VNQRIGATCTTAFLNSTNQLFLESQLQDFTVTKENELFGYYLLCI